jgi:hypothetical protein
MEQQDSDVPSKTIDPFFETIHDGEWNACVGIQGDAENYVDGYLEAALELAAAVIDKRLIASRDTLAMPILYNCRHGLELSLKYFISRLHKTGMLTQGHPANHDIESHWRHLQSAAVGSVDALGDATLRLLVADLEPYVKSLAAIDGDGQELRYAQNRDGQTSLSGIAIVNLSHISHSIETLSRLLQRLKLRVHEIEEERFTGAHTANCSRKDLEMIAKIMGDHFTWRDQSFFEKKDLVMKQFGLSRGKFSDAIDAIRKSRGLAALVGLEASLKYLRDEKAVEVLKLWVEANQLVESGDGLGVDYFNRDWTKHKEWMGRAKQLDEAALGILSLEELADLETLYYLGRERGYGEHYDDLLDKAIRSCGEEISWHNVHYLMSKTNLLDAVVDGAARAGRPSLARKLRHLRSAETA